MYGEEFEGLIASNFDRLVVEVSEHIHKACTFTIQERSRYREKNFAKWKFTEVHHTLPLSKIPKSEIGPGKRIDTHDAAEELAQWIHQKACEEAMGTPILNARLRIRQAGYSGYVGGCAFQVVNRNYEPAPHQEPKTAVLEAYTSQIMALTRQNEAISESGNRTMQNFVETTSAMHGHLQERIEREHRQEIAGWKERFEELKKECRQLKHDKKFFETRSTDLQDRLLKQGVALHAQAGQSTARDEQLGRVGMEIIGLAHHGIDVVAGQHASRLKPLLDDPHVSALLEREPEEIQRYAKVIQENESVFTALMGAAELLEALKNPELLGLLQDPQVVNFLSQPAAPQWIASVVAMQASAAGPSAGTASGGTEGGATADRGAAAGAGGDRGSTGQGDRKGESRAGGSGDRSGEGDPSGGGTGARADPASEGDFGSARASDGTGGEGTQAGAKKSYGADDSNDGEVGDRGGGESTEGQPTPSGLGAGDGLSDACNAEGTGSAADVGHSAMSCGGSVSGGGVPRPLDMGFGDASSMDSATGVGDSHAICESGGEPDSAATKGSPGGGDEELSPEVLLLARRLHRLPGLVTMLQQPTIAMALDSPQFQELMRDPDVQQRIVAQLAGVLMPGIAIGEISDG